MEPRVSETIVIPFRYRGPPNSGNGGYVAGAIAERFAARIGLPDDSAIEVTLRAPRRSTSTWRSSGQTPRTCAC
jgi:hypothetical protein